jgi:hypothetical protein
MPMRPTTAQNSESSALAVAIMRAISRTEVLHGLGMHSDTDAVAYLDTL